jgi:uncharacterized protein (TIGR02453 family)
LWIKKEIEIFWAHLFWELNTFDESLQTPGEKPYMFRIYRDARFAKGRPYKNNYGILIGQWWKPAMHQKAGYFLNIEPWNCFLIWWIWRPEPFLLKNIRNNISENPDEINNILNNKKFKKYFSLRWSQLKTAPRWFAKEHPEVELLRYKDFYAVYNFKDEEILSENFMKELVKISKILYPFNKFINNLSVK